jgi:peptide/nickel transport system substrate-binding protein
VTAGDADGRSRVPAPSMPGRRSAPARHRIPCSVVLALTALLAAACASGGGSQTPAASHVTQPTAPRLVPRVGGTVTLALDQVPTTLNDHTVAGDTPAGRMVASAVWAQVFRVGPGLVPALDTNVVDSAEVVSLQPQTVVYQIDPRAVWSDGVPISSADFTYAWQSQRGGAFDVDGSPDSVASALGYRDISSLTGSNGGRTVTVVFRTPFADWTSLFDDLLPAHIAMRVGWNHGFDHFNPAVLVSGGPWRVVSWTPGSKIVLGRNPRWWASPVALKRLVVRAVPTSGAMADDLGGNRVQVAYPSAFGQSFMAQVSSSAVLQSSSTLGTRMLQLAFNTRHTLLSAAPIRQGIAHDIDRAGLVTVVGQPENHLVWEDNDHLLANLQSAYTDDAAGYEKADPATGSRLLEQGGLSLDTRGTWSVRDKAVSLDLAWASDDPWSAATGPIIAAQLVAAGFEVVSDPMSSSQLFGTVLPQGDFDLAVLPVDAGAYPSAIAGVFSTSPAITAGTTSQDYSGFDDPKIDALFVQAVQQLAPPQAQAIYGQIDQDLWTDMPTLPLFAEPTVLVSSASVSGVRDDPGGLGPLWNARSWVLLAPQRTRSTTSG